MNNIIKIYISLSKESEKGLGYWVYLVRNDGGRMSPYMSYHMDMAIYTAAEWASFLGIEPDILVPNEHLGLTQAMIDNGYKESEFMVDTLKYNTWMH